jgi:protein SCO1/2
MKRFALLAMLVLAGCGDSKAPTFAGVALDSTPPAPNFALEDQKGRTVTVAAQRGHWLVVTFLYTHCPDVCPLIAANLNTAIASPAGKKADLHVIAVSVDPKRDTLAAIHTYAVQHQLASSFRYVTGPQPALEKVWRDYHVAAQPGPKNTVTHSTFEILIDPQGDERLIYDDTITAAELESDLSKLTG